MYAMVPHGNIAHIVPEGEKEIREESESQHMGIMFDHSSGYDNYQRVGKGGQRIATREQGL